MTSESWSWRGLVVGGLAALLACDADLPCDSTEACFDNALMPGRPDAAYDASAVAQEAGSKSRDAASPAAVLPRDAARDAVIPAATAEATTNSERSDASTEPGLDPCTTDGDCYGDFCELDSGQCVDCLLGSNDGCPDGTHCTEGVAGGRACVECTTDAHCEGSLAGPACWQQRCVPCVPAPPLGDGGSAQAAAHCPAERPWCEFEPNEPGQQRCVACLSDEDCGADAPVCDSSGTCVGCTQHDDCAVWAPELGQCAPELGNCVACTVDEHCGDADAARCDPQTNRCVPCETSASCSGITGKPVCFDGLCVECSVEDETPCGDHACLPDTNTCGDTRRGSRGLCERCAADSECTGGEGEPVVARCVLQQFEGRQAAGYCLRRAVAGCPDAIYEFPVEASSLSGAAKETYCGISATLTSCEAVLDLANAARTCPSGQDEACGCARDAQGACINTPSGGLCRAVGLAENRCTYPCGSPSQCPPGYGCTTEQPWCH